MRNGMVSGFCGKLRWGIHFSAIVVAKSNISLLIILLIFGAFSFAPTVCAGEYSEKVERLRQILEDADQKMPRSDQQRLSAQRDGLRHLVEKMASLAGDLDANAGKIDDLTGMEHFRKTELESAGRQLSWFLQQYQDESSKIARDWEPLNKAWDEFDSRYSRFYTGIQNGVRNYVFPSNQDGTPNPAYAPAVAENGRLESWGKRLEQEQKDLENGLGEQIEKQKTTKQQKEDEYQEIEAKLDGLRSDQKQQSAEFAAAVSSFAETASHLPLSARKSILVGMGSIPGLHPFPENTERVIPDGYTGEVPTPDSQNLTPSGQLFNLSTLNGPEGAAKSLEKLKYMRSLGIDTLLPGFSDSLFKDHKNLGRNYAKEVQQIGFEMSQKMRAMDQDLGEKRERLAIIEKNPNAAKPGELEQLVEQDIPTLIGKLDQGTAILRAYRSFQEPPLSTSPGAPQPINALQGGGTLNGTGGAVGNKSPQ